VPADGFFHFRQVRRLIGVPIMLGEPQWEEAMVTLGKALEYLVEKGPDRTEVQLAKAIYGELFGYQQIGEPGASAVGLARQDRMHRQGRSLRSL